MSEELKLCDHCGAEARLSCETMGDREAYAEVVHIVCQGCGLSISRSGDTSKGGYADNSHVREDAIKAWNRRATPTVKPLEWEHLGHGFYRAVSPLFGSIRIEHYGKKVTVTWSVPGYCDTFTPGEFASTEEAKAAAQADYTRRILSAIKGAGE